MKYELENFHRDIPDEELLGDLRRVGKELGKNRVTFREYNKLGRFSSGTIAERFSSWHAAIDKANLQRTIDRNISDEELFENLVEIWTALGRQPRSRDLRPGPSRFSWKPTHAALGLGARRSHNLFGGPTRAICRLRLTEAQGNRIGVLPETSTGNCVHLSSCAMAQVAGFVGRRR